MFFLPRPNVSLLCKLCIERRILNCPLQDYDLGDDDIDLDDDDDDVSQFMNLSFIHNPVSYKDNVSR